MNYNQIKQIIEINIFFEKDYMTFLINLNF